MILAVTGGREFEPTPFSLKMLLLFLSQCSIMVNGGCRGADLWADQVAIGAGVKVIRARADWQKHGKAAGPIRNREVVKGADLLLAFPGGKGTADCIKAAREAGVPVVRVEG